MTLVTRNVSLPLPVTTRIVRCPPRSSIVQVSPPIRSDAPSNGARITASAASRVMPRIAEAFHEV